MSTFSEALDLMKFGKRAAREGWNGKGMWIGLVGPENYIIHEAPHGDGQDTEEGECKGLRPWIGMFTADQHFVPWVASQSDLLSEDWVIVD